MHNALAAGAIATVCLLTACSREPEPTQAEEPAEPARRDFALRIPYSGHGYPGPWWRDNAMHEDFDDDQAACQTASKAARKAATENRRELAHRAFLDCMHERGWTRGAPPH